MHVQCRTLEDAQLMVSALSLTINRLTFEFETKMFKGAPLRFFDMAGLNFFSSR
jgi:hypothetical protein